MTAAEEHVYSYPFASSLSAGAQHARLTVAASGGAANEEPLFYAGGLAAPGRAAGLLRAVSGIAATRFYVPPAMLQRILLAADPIVLSDGERLRFESLSACCGVYARADLLPAALANAPLARGATNVDFNPPMRAALAGLRDDDAVRLVVGDDGVGLEVDGRQTIERRVAIPARWIRGLGEVQALQAGMAPRLAVSGAEAFRFLRSLPRGGTGRSPCYVVQTGARLRLAHTPMAGSVRVAGAERLRALEPCAREAAGLTVFAHESGASAWLLELADARLVTVVSPEPSRGLSGEGALLDDVIESDAAADARLLASLRWQARLAPEDVARKLGLGSSQAGAALSRLAAAGLVGYDLAEGGYFYRALPLGRPDSGARLARLVAARRLVDAGRVRVERSDGRLRALVTGRGGDYIVAHDDEAASCTCAWFAKHGRDRGPCSHVLAVRMTSPA